MRGKLNLFQATMLRWRELHPYSAVHVVRITRGLDAARLRELIALQLEDLGLTGLIVDWQHRRFMFQGGPASVQLSVFAGGSDPITVICGEMERQLNTPFPCEGSLLPFRFFAVDAGAAFHLGIAYDHFIAGGDSIVVVLRGIVERYAGNSGTALPTRPLQLYPATYGRLFLRYPGYLLRGLPTLLRMVASCRRSVRPPARVDQPAPNGLVHLRVGPEGFAALTRTAKIWGVTLNDLLLAMLLQALSPLAPDRSRAARRKELAVASIMNIRREFQPAADETFGQFLGSFRVSHAVPAATSLQQLARDVHRETSRIKSRKLYLQTLLVLALSGLSWRFLSVQQRRGVFAKNYPVWAGVSTLNVTSLWKHHEPDASSLEYMRTASTGPLAPMVLAVTTAGNVMHVGISFRTIDITREMVDAVAARFHQLVENLSP